MKSQAFAVPASQVKRERVEWLWPGRIPIGGVTVLAGQEGLGKSLLTCDLAARLSRGDFGEPGLALMATAEDSLAATVRPRLEAAGADLERVCFVRVRRGEDDDGLSLPGDIPELDRLVEESGARLVVIDPLMAHLHGSVNSWNDQSVRLALSPLHRLAERHRCAVLPLLHLNKAVGHDPLRRVGGSVGLTAAARSALLLARDPDDAERDQGRRRVLAHVKSNLGAYAQSLVYEVRPIVLPARLDEPEAETARIVEVGESSYGGRDLLMPPDEERVTKLDEAVEFLTRELAEGTKASAEVKEAARSLGIAEKTLRRAREHLGIEDEREGFPAKTVWRLPAGRAHAALSPSTAGDGHYCESQHVEAVPGVPDASRAPLLDMGTTGSTASTGALPRNAALSTLAEYHREKGSI